MNSSKPAGESKNSSLAGPECTVTVWGTSLGPKTNEPGPASIVSSPIWNVSSPSRTQKASSSRWCTCSGASPSGSSTSTSVYCPPVSLPVALIVARPPSHHLASPSPSSSPKALETSSFVGSSFPCSGLGGRRGGVPTISHPYRASRTAKLSDSASPVVSSSSDGSSDSDGGRVRALAGLLMASTKPSKPGGESKNSSLAGPESTV